MLFSHVSLVSLQKKKNQHEIRSEKPNVMMRCSPKPRVDGPYYNSESELKVYAFDGRKENSSIGMLVRSGSDLMRCAVLGVLVPE